MSTVDLQIDGMTCGHCVARVTKALQKVPGVAVETVEIGTARLVVHEAAGTAEAVAALHDAGYEARPQPPSR